MDLTRRTLLKAGGLTAAVGAVGTGREPAFT